MDARAPGIRSGVQPGSDAHLTEYFGPVLGVMTAATLEDAVDLVNAVDYGLTSGLHSLDDEEIGGLERLRAAVRGELGDVLATHLLEAEVAMLERRVDRVLADPVLPGPQGAWPPIPWPPF